MDEHNMVYSHSEVLFGNKNEWTTDSCNGINELYKHVERNQPSTNQQVRKEQPLKLIREQFSL